MLIVSPYHGGSHQAWAESYQRASGHEVRLLTLPARFWKWRMHGGAVTLARQLMADLESGAMPAPELIVATDMLDLTTFMALARDVCAHTPLVLYMHENQLTYPLPPDPRTGPMRRQRGERDHHYAFINYASMLAADHILFNSQFHRDSLLRALPRFLRHFPEHNELDSLLSLREKSSVLPIGLDLDALAPDPQPLAAAERSAAPEPPLILWNQRWEYDKNPALFFAALYQMHREGIPFRVALCGERFSRTPGEFDDARAWLGHRLVHSGYAAPAEYRRLLWDADIVISTALHEFFGMSILEAIYCQNFPILPNDLSYPELIPQPFHEHCLYDDEAELLARLRWALHHRHEAKLLAAQLAPSVERFGWKSLSGRYDALFTGLGGSLRA